jgi:hypothetical protein
MNDGFGNFRHAENALPKMNVSGGAITALDFDGDADADLFIGGRILTGQYPFPPRSYLLRNDGGRFVDVTDSVAPDLVRPGMVTDALWFDTNGDSKNELVIAGEWMPIRFFEIENSRLQEITNEVGFQNTNGLWNSISVTDINADGLPDILAGNLGLNHFLKASQEEPAIIYYGDFNENGLRDPVVTYVYDRKRVPFPDRDLFLRQVSGFEKSFPTYESWAQSDIRDILGDAIDDAYSYEAETFASTLFLNNGNGQFEAIDLPPEVQMAPVYDFFAGDFFEDQRPEIMAAGNNYGTRPELGPLASEGAFFRFNENNEFEVFSSKESGFYSSGDVRHIEFLPSTAGPLFLLGAHGVMPQMFLYQGSD